LVLAVLAAIPFRWVEPVYQSAFFPNPQQLFYVFIWLNVVLVFFNLLPIHPLDGFKVVGGLLPYNAAQTFNKLAPIGPLLLLFLIFFGGSVFTAIVIAPTNFVVGLLI
jgi:Zn-dependent protease